MHLWVRPFDNVEIFRLPTFPPKLIIGFVNCSTIIHGRYSLYCWTHMANLLGHSVCPGSMTQPRLSLNCKNRVPDPNPKRTYGQPFWIIIFISQTYPLVKWKINGSFMSRSTPSRRLLVSSLWFHRKWLLGTFLVRGSSPPLFPESNMYLPLEKRSKGWDIPKCDYQSVPTHVTSRSTRFKLIKY